MTSPINRRTFVKGSMLASAGAAIASGATGRFYSLPALEKAGDDLASIRSNLAEALTVLADTTGWLLHHGLEDPRNALAGAVADS